MAARFDPVAEMTDMARAVSRLLGEPAGQPAHAIPVDIVETDDALEVTAFFPGVRRDAVSVELVSGVLAFRGERPMPSAGAGRVLYSESPYGRFERRVAVGRGVRGEGAEAAWRDGALTVRLPKADALRPHAIAIRDAASDAAAIGAGEGEGTIAAEA